VFAPESRILIEEELQRAEMARGQGQEGRARVCARRAAGAALREALRLRGADPIPASAIDLLRLAQDMPELSSRSRQAVERLLQKVDEGFGLPQSWDLLSEARFLIAELDQAA
jgi:hypothetical protein